MKLEQKHLAPYLPYGLKVRQFENTIFLSNYNLIGRNIEQCLLDQDKPILRPLSDLTKDEVKVIREIECVSWYHVDSGHIYYPNRKSNLGCLGVFLYRLEPPLPECYLKPLKTPLIALNSVSGLA